MLQSQYRILKTNDCYGKKTAIIWFIKALLFELYN